MQVIPAPAVPIVHGQAPILGLQPSIQAENAPIPAPSVISSATSSPPLNNTYFLTSLITQLQTSPSVSPAHRQNLGHLFKLSQESVGSSVSLINLHVLNSLTPFISSKFPDQTFSERAVGIVANLCYDIWQHPHQHESLFNALFPVLLSLLIGATERIPPVRAQAYRALWNLLTKYEKLKRDTENPCCRNVPFLTRLVKDMTSPYEQLRRMVAGCIWTLAENQTFCVEFTNAKGVDYVIHSLDLRFENTPETQYIILSALHVLCTGSTAKRRIGERNGLNSVLKILREDKKAQITPLVVGRIADVISSLCFNSAPHQRQLTRLNGIRIISHFLAASLKSHSQYLIQSQRGNPNTTHATTGIAAMFKSLSRLCICMLAVCYRNPELDTTITGSTLSTDAASWIRDMEAAVVTKTIQQNKTNPIDPTGNK